MRLYDFMRRHSLLRWASLAVATVLLVVLTARQRYVEDIAAFLPLEGGQQEVFQEYQNSQAARCIYVMFRGEGEQEASELFCELLDEADRKLLTDFATAFDGEMALPDVSDSLLEALPTTVFVGSPYHASETRHNARLVERLQATADRVGAEYPDVDIHLTGGPVVAVGNARQIKTDSTTAIVLATVLTCLLLWLALGSVRHVLLIALATAWGWLFAMGCLTLVHRDVSVIVIGVSSVIMGIAVNYPLHLMAHLRHAADVRTALKEIVTPLTVGNVTTVGAFLTLVPLESEALRDLGLFSALLLTGTMCFVMLWLPHMTGDGPATRGWLDWMGDVRLEDWRWTPWVAAALTLTLGCLCGQTSFDADVQNINYMTEAQRHDMQLFNDLMGAAPGDGMREVTAAIINRLTDNLNYIGWACGVIVFGFLWLSLGCIELALLAFLPMAVSWIWILGFMALLDIQFNVVNIILATFIFGQGDDYTIFMTEGCQYEYAYRRQMLRSYRHVTAVSALMMLTGIGVLLTARHPALRSLAEVTIVGMVCVVLTAWTLPAVGFRWLVYDGGRERRWPLTLRRLLWRGGDETAAYVADCYRYRGAEIATAVNRGLRRHLRRDDGRWRPGAGTVVVTDCGWGEVVMYEALRWPEVHFVAVEGDDDKRRVASHVAELRAPNITFLAGMPEMPGEDAETIRL